MITFNICTGTIPEELGRLGVLKELYLDSNNLSGEKTKKAVFGGEQKCRTHAYMRHMF